MTKQQEHFNISDLPLSDKVDVPSIFTLLGLPHTSNLSVVRKAYYKRVDQLEKEKATSSNEELVLSLRTLEKTFQEYSKNLEKNTKDLYETKKSLDGLGLDSTATWDTIRDRFDTLSSQADGSNKEQLNKHYNTLKENKNWFISNDKVPVKTLYAGLGVLAASGITIAAISQYTDTSISDLVSGWIDKFNSSVSGSVADDSTADLLTSDTLTNEPLQGLSNAGQESAAASYSGMQEYIDSNLSFEDDLLSTLGLMPDIHETLGVSFKVEMLQSLVKTI